MKHLKKRRKFELLIYDLKKVLAAPAIDDRYGVLFGLTYDVLSFVEDICRDPEKAAMLIDATRMAREALGEGRDCAEEKLMQALDFAVHTCMDAFDDTGFHSFLMFPSCDGCPDALEAQCRIMRDICAYAIDCFAFKTPRPVCGYAARRRISNTRIGWLGIRYSRCHTAGEGGSKAEPQIGSTWRHRFSGSILQGPGRGVHSRRCRGQQEGRSLILTGKWNKLYMKELIKGKQT